MMAFNTVLAYLRTMIVAQCSMQYARGPQIVGRDPNLGLQIIYRLYVQQEKHITGTCNVIEQGWAINLARGPL